MPHAGEYGTFFSITGLANARTLAFFARSCSGRSTLRTLSCESKLIHNAEILELSLGPG